MTFHRIFRASALAIFGICSASAHAAIVFGSNGNGSYSVTRNALGANGWEVEITCLANANQNFNVTVRANAPNDSIAWVRVTTGSVGTVGLAIDCVSYSLGDTIPVLREVTKVGGSAPLVLSSINEIGQLGVSSGGTTIAVDSIGDIYVLQNSNQGYTGHVYGDISALRAAPYGIIERIEAAGDIKANITATDFITRVYAGQRLGSATPAAPVTITAANRIRHVRAATMNADIECTATDSQIQRIETTAAGGYDGDFNGSAQAENLHNTAGGGIAVGWKIVGDLAADLIFTDDILDPIDIDGSMTGDISCRDLESLVTIGATTADSLDGNVTIARDLFAPTSGTTFGAIQVAGDINGAISIGQHMVATTAQHAYIRSGDDINGSITIGGSMQSATGHQATIETTTSGGDLTNSITVGGAANGKIEIDGSFTAGTIDLNSSFAGTIAVGGSITGGTIDVSSDASGAITVGNDVESSGSIIIRGNANANITVTDDMGGLINIGGSLNTGKSIAAQSLMLGTSPGHVIINSLNSTGAWNGDVTINSVTLATKPLYSNTGLGGSVGLPKFNLHADDCTPADEGTTPPGETWIFVRFYGPVTWDENEDMPFIIQYRTTGGSNWTDDTANWFVHSGKGTRTIQLGYQDGITDPSPIPSGRDYRIIPILTGDAALMSDKLLSTTPLTVEDFTYYFYTP